MAKTDFKTIDEYIGTFPGSTQTILKKMRDSILKAVPEAKEGISYQIPAFKINGKYFVYFSGYQRHVSLYPAPVEGSLKKELAPYLSGKRTAKFPVDKPIPFDLIGKTAEFLAERKIDKEKKKQQSSSADKKPAK